MHTVRSVILVALHLLIFGLRSLIILLPFENNISILGEATAIPGSEWKIALQLNFLVKHFGFVFSKNHKIYCTSQVSVILFLNKMDLLEDKVTRKKVDISQYFPEFDQIETIRSYVNNKFGGDPLNVADVKNFILYLFSVKQKFIHSQRPIYHHFTTAVNTKNIQYVFTSVKETILRKNLSALMLQ